MATEASIARRTTSPTGARRPVGAPPATVPRWSTFTAFFVVATCVRPFLDLTAARRTGGVQPTEIFGVVVLAVMAAWLFHHRRLLAQRMSTSLSLALVALVAAYAVATIGSPEWGTSLTATLRVATGVAIFFVTDLLLRLGRLTLQQMLLLVLLAGLGPMLYPLLAVVGVPVTHEKDGITALKSVFFLSNNFAFFLVPLLLVSLAWAMAAQGRLRLLAGAYTAVVLVELVLAQTRGAWLGAAVGVVLLCVLMRRPAVLAVLAVLVLAALAVPSVNSRLTNLEPDPDNPYSQSSLAWRVNQWDRVALYVGDNPVTGGGPGATFRLTGKEAHNDYLKAVVDTGVVGLAAYLWVLAAAVGTAWAAFGRVRRLSARSPRSPAAKPLVAASLAAIAAYSVVVVGVSVGDNFIDNLTFLWGTMPLLGIASWARSCRPRRLRIGE